MESMPVLYKFDLESDPAESPHSRDTVWPEVIQQF